MCRKDVWPNIYSIYMSGHKEKEVKVKNNNYIVAFMTLGIRYNGKQMQQVQFLIHLLLPALFLPCCYVPTNPGHAILQPLCC